MSFETDMYIYIGITPVNTLIATKRPFACTKLTCDHNISRIYIAFFVRSNMIDTKCNHDSIEKGCLWYIYNHAAEL